MQCDRLGVAAACELIDGDVVARNPHIQMLSNIMTKSKPIWVASAEQRAQEDSVSDLPTALAASPIHIGLSTSGRPTAQPSAVLSKIGGVATSIVRSEDCA
jgi:hypothetical protein